MKWIAYGVLTIDANMQDINIISLLFQTLPKWVTGVIAIAESANETQKRKQRKLNQNLTI